MGTHEQNFKYWFDQAEEILKKLSNARKPEIYLNQLKQIKDKATKYANYFGIDIFKPLDLLLSITDKAEIVAYLETKQKLIEADKKRIEKEKAKAHKIALSKWRKFESQTLYTRDGFDYLRKDSENFQTSQGVKIPLAVGLRFYNNLINNKVKAGETFLNYTISEVSKKLIKIGCHTITLKEINAIVK